MTVTVRLLLGVKEHFTARKAEWACAFMSMGVGMVFLGPGETFSVSPVYGGMARMASENAWGAACASVGAVRLVALFINGNFPQTWYGRWSAHVRALLAFFACFVWTSLWLGILSAGFITAIGLAIWPSVLFLEIANVLEATDDARDANKRAGNAGG